MEKRVRAEHDEDQAEEDTGNDSSDFHTGQGVPFPDEKTISKGGNSLVPEKRQSSDAALEIFGYLAAV
jgi:hypothetical protein